MSGSEVVASNPPLPEQVAQEPSGMADAGAAPESQGAHEQASSTAEAAEGNLVIKEVSVGDLEQEVRTTSDPAQRISTADRRIRDSGKTSSRRSVRMSLLSLDRLL